MKNDNDQPVNKYKSVSKLRIEKLQFVKSTFTNYICT